MGNFLGPTNNKKAAQFLTRTGSYSTHGNKKGFVDEDFGQLPQDQLHPIGKRLKELGLRMDSYNRIIKQVRDDLGIKPHMSLKKYERFAKSGVLNKSRKDSRKLLDVLPIVELKNELDLEIKSLKDKMAGIKPHSRNTRMLNILRTDYLEIFTEISKKVDLEFEEIMEQEFQQFQDDYS